MELGLWATSTTVHEDISRRVRQIAEGTAAAWDVSLEIDHIGEAPNVRQDEELAQVVERVATRLPRVTNVDKFVSCMIAGTPSTPACVCSDQDSNSILDLNDVTPFVDILLGNTAPASPCS